MNTTGLEEIVVTAQRRPESVQKSSLSIAVVNGADLVRRGVTEARDLAAVTPSVAISQNGAFTQTNIRGAGDAATNGLAQLAVSYAVDGSVVGQGPSISQNFYDLARVEVLKGPQGTLYGRNATGGAVNILTNRPTQKFEGYVTAEYGNYDYQRLTGALNTPVTDTLAIRGAFNFIDRDGYLSDGTDDDQRESGRIQAYWEPSDVFNLRLYADYSHTGGHGGGVVLFPRQPGLDPWTAVSHPINNAAMAGGLGGLHPPFLTDSRIDLDQWDFAAEMNLRLGDFATLTLIPTYRDLRLEQVTYNFAMRAQFDPETSEQTSFEARLGNQSDQIKWVLGAFYYGEDTSFDQTIMPLAAPAFINNFNTTADIDSKNRSYAAFGETTYSVTEQFRVIGGLRYTRDEVSFGGSYTDNADPILAPNPGSPYPQRGDETFSKVTWKAGVEYDVAADSMIYSTVSKGYKSGGFFYVPGGTDNTYDAETITAYDVGLRSRFLDNTLQVNVEAFYWRYRDQQLPAVGFTSAGSIAYVTRNAGSSNPRGAGVDVIWKPTSNDTLSFNANYTRARFEKFQLDFPAALIGLLRAGPDCSVPATPTLSAAGLPVFKVDCSGAPLVRTPEWSGAFNYEHVFRLADAGDVSVNLGAIGATSRFLSTDFFVPEAKDGSYVLLSADLTYTSADEVWSISAFGKNLADEAVYQGGIADSLNGFAGPGPTFYDRTIAPPRTYGVRGTFRF